jgi:hypothetical protein
MVSDHEAVVLFLRNCRLSSSVPQAITVHESKMGWQLDGIERVFRVFTVVPQFHRVISARPDNKTIVPLAILLENK